MAIARRKAKKVTKKKVVRKAAKKKVVRKAAKKKAVRRRDSLPDPEADFAKMLEGLGFWVDTRGYSNSANIRIGERGEILSRSVKLQVKFDEVTDHFRNPTGKIAFQISIDQISDNREGPFHSSAEGSRRFFESLISALKAFSKKIEERPWYS